jgi:HAD superfamily hydrolase (TIGR01490 family)
LLNTYRKLSVFDLDHTLLEVNSSYAFCRYLYRRKVLPFSAVIYAFLYRIRHRLGLLSLSELHERVFHKLLVGRCIDSLESCVDEFVEEEILPALYVPAVSELRLSQQLGHFTLIVSNSPSFLVRAIASALNVDAWRGTEYAVDKQKRLCNISSIMQGDLKANCVLEMALKLGISKEGVTAYSDSHLDLPFLLAAGNIVAVNPDRKLRALSKKHQWRIL